MKNIHLLTTDKPSRLWLSTRKENYLIFDKFPRGGVEYVEPKNIYITSEKDIKDNDWIITKDGRLVQVSYLLSKELDNASKIILTTDQDLINDGVQAIDDEFLEWFVKNPSCEFINVDEKTPDEIEVELNIHGHDIGLTDREFDEWLNNGGQLYKIIIPKKEPKQETLEQIAKRIALETFNKTFSDYPKGGKISNETLIDSLILFFRLGSEWQQEQNKNLYNEEEVEKIAKHSYNEALSSVGFSKIQFGDWFNKLILKQFKK